MQAKVESLRVERDLQPIVIGPEQPLKDYFKDCFQYRDLFFFLSLRDVQVRYKQAFLGVSWALIRPLLNMVLFTIVFGRLASLPSHNVNYSLFVLAGILPWQFFVSYVSEGSMSLLNNSNLITKLYFPRILIALSGMFVHLIDFVIGFLFLVVLSVFLGYGNFWSLFLLAPFIITMLLLGIGTVFWLSAFTVKYRDFRFIIPLVFQFGMFISPVAYDSDLINPKWFTFYALNPMVGIIEGFRFIFFGIASKGLIYSVSCSILFSAMIFTTGFIYFKRMEKYFADQI